MPILIKYKEETMSNNIIRKADATLEDQEKILSLLLSMANEEISE